MDENAKMDKTKLTEIQQKSKKLEPVHLKDKLIKVKESLRANKDMLDSSLKQNEKIKDRRTKSNDKPLNIEVHPKDKYSKEENSQASLKNIESSNESPKGGENSNIDPKMNGEIDKSELTEVNYTLNEENEKMKDETKKLKNDQGTNKNQESNQVTEKYSDKNIKKIKMSNKDTDKNVEEIKMSINDTDKKIEGNPKKNDNSDGRSTVLSSPGGRVKKRRLSLLERRRRKRGNSTGNVGQEIEMKIIPRTKRPSLDYAPTILIHDFQNNKRYLLTPFRYFKAKTCYHA